jgi:NAD-dependent SIR2 family protein deacetylase
MSHEVEDYYKAYVEERVLAAETCRCSACGERIPYGMPYTLVVIVDAENEEEMLRRCERCQKIHKHLREVAAESEMWPDERLACGEDYKEHWGHEPPPEIAALAFARPGDDP